MTVCRLSDTSTWSSATKVARLSPIFSEEAVSFPDNLLPLGNDVDSSAPS